MAFKTTTTAANAALDGLTAQLNGGSLRIYSGAEPANAGDALGAQVLLATLPLSATAFGAAVSGTATTTLPVFTSGSAGTVAVATVGGGGVRRRSRGTPQPSMPRRPAQTVVSVSHAVTLPAFQSIAVGVVIPNDCWLDGLAENEDEAVLELI